MATKIKTPQDMFEEKQKNISARMNEKDKQIAYFNSVNAAIEMVKERIGREDNPETIGESIVNWRDWFYQEWQIWYLENIMAVRGLMQKKESQNNPNIADEDDLDYGILAEEERIKKANMEMAELEAELPNL